jgi:hypothetical protein
MTSTAYEMTIAATGEKTIHQDLGDAFAAAAKATGIAAHEIAESGHWNDRMGGFIGGYEDDGSDGFTIRRTVV